MKTLALALAALLMSVSAAIAHPLHTSFARVTMDTKSGTINVSVRVFSDDLAAAATAAKSTTSSYIAGRFVIRNASGAVIPFKSCGEKRSGDLTWVCLDAKTGVKSSTITLLSSVFFEKYSDQVNVVSFVTAEGTSNILFSAGDKPVRID